MYPYLPEFEILLSISRKVELFVASEDYFFPPPPQLLFFFYHPFNIFTKLLVVLVFM